MYSTTISHTLLSILVLIHPLHVSMVIADSTIHLSSVVKPYLSHHGYGSNNVIDYKAQSYMRPSYISCVV